MRPSFPLSLLALSVLTACNTYDLEPVTPFLLSKSTQTYDIVARPLTPRILFVLDTSNSMNTPINALDPACAAGCGPAAPCAPGCRTRISELRAAIDGLLTGPDTAATAQWGLVTFPADLSCGGPTSAQVPFGAGAFEQADERLATAMAVNARVQTLTPVGGTPTAAALRFARTQFRDDVGGDRFVVLVTDGLPNCNEQSANNVCSCGASCAPQEAACRCTLASCQGANCATGCLDDADAVAAIRELRLQGIRVVVIGFGGDLGNGDAAQVLQAMGEAGDFPPSCLNGTDAECGPDAHCQANGLCDRAFWRADDSAGLQWAFRGFVYDPTCTFAVDPRPSAAPLLVVQVNGQRISPGPQTWEYSAADGTLTLLGALCDQMRQSNVNHPFRLALSSFGAQ